MQDRNSTYTVPATQVDVVEERSNIDEDDLTRASPAISESSSFSNPTFVEEWRHSSAIGDNPPELDQPHCSKAMARTTVSRYLHSSHSVAGYEHHQASSTIEQLLNQDASLSQKLSTVKVRNLNSLSSDKYQDLSITPLEEEFELNEGEGIFNLGRISHGETNEQNNGARSFWSFLPLRRFFYFTLSKPTHWDVELLEKIHSFGKKKFVLLILLLLFLPILGLIYQHGGFKVGEEEKMKMVKREMFVDQLGSKMAQFQVNTKHSMTMTEREKKILFKRFLKNEFSQRGIVGKEKMVNTEMFVDQFGSKMKQFQDNTKQSMVMTELEMEILFKRFLEKELSQRGITEDFLIMKKQMLDFQVQLEDFGVEMDFMKRNSAKLTVQSEQSTHLQKDLQKVTRNLEAKFSIIDALLNQAKNCCMNNTQVQEHFVDFLLQLTDGDSTNPAFHSFKTWMSTMFVNGQQLQKEIEIIRQTLQEEKKLPPSFIEAQLENRLKAIEEEFSSKFKSWIKQDINSSIDFFNSRVEEIIKQAIMLYDSDKTGQTDYALESGGGAIVSTRCSETYNEGRPSLMLFGFRLWDILSSPRYAIQPEVHPGQCWAFKGSQGYLVIELSATIRPTGFVIEHIAKSLSPSGSINSAPKQFTVWGLKSENDSKGKLLGDYTYDKEGEPLQYFPVMDIDDMTYYSYVELKILSNHGDLKYTCLYRFRVHGVRQ